MQPCDIPKIKGLIFRCVIYSSTWIHETRYAPKYIYSWDLDLQSSESTRSDVRATYFRQRTNLYIRLGPKYLSSIWNNVFSWLGYIHIDWLCLNCNRSDPSRNPCPIDSDLEFVLMRHEWRKRESVYSAYKVTFQHSEWFQDHILIRSFARKYRALRPEPSMLVWILRHFYSCLHATKFILWGTGWYIFTYLVGGCRTGILYSARVPLPAIVCVYACFEILSALSASNLSHFYSSFSVPFFLFLPLLPTYLFSFCPSLFTNP